MESAETANLEGEIHRFARGTSGDISPVECPAEYLSRKRREIDVIKGCLDRSPALPAPTSVAQTIDQKFRLAAALRAERSLQSWAVTETARPEIRHWRSGAFEFSFGYQRADLVARGPPVYPSAGIARMRNATLYTGSGMSAIAALLTAALRARGALDIFVPRGVYGESRELMASLAPRVRVLPYRFAKQHADAADSASRLLWIDSCVPAGFRDFESFDSAGLDLVVFDTTCFGQTSSRIRRVVDWAARVRVPSVLVRSHAKLDCLGIEYGRLGSLVFVWKNQQNSSMSVGALVQASRTSVRLFGAAALPSHFPPFTGNGEYLHCTRQRLAATLRNTRHMARRLRASSGSARHVGEFQHGLYLTLTPGKEHRVGEVKRAVSELCDRLAGRGLPVKHAGSFGFDFAALDWFPDPVSRRNVIRVAPGDLPLAVVDRIVDEVDTWWRDAARPRAGPRRPRFDRVDRPGRREMRR